MSGQSLQNIESSSELPVEALYNHAVADFIALHGELSKMPADPSDPLQNLDSMLRDMGVERDNDMSMFIIGAMGHVAIDSVAGAFGMAANSSTAIAADIGMTMAADMKDGRDKKAEAKGKAPTVSVFSKSKFKRAADAKVKPAPKMATSLLMAASAKPKAKNNPSKRIALRRAMNKRREEIELLGVFKKQGYTHAKKITKTDRTGQKMSFWVPSETKPTMAFTMQGGKPQQMKAQAPTLKLAA